jgi:hypothetical protein
MRRLVQRWVLVALSLTLSGCSADGRVLLSMQVLVLNTAQLSDGGKWNDLLGRPLIALEYATRAEGGSGDRALYLYDIRGGECLAILRAPRSPGDPMLITWTPCK